MKGNYVFELSTIISKTEHTDCDTDKFEIVYTNAYLDWIFIQTK